MKSTIGIVLIIFGGIIISIGLFLFFQSFISLFEDISFDSGLYFASTENFLIIAVLLLIAGIALILAGKTLLVGSGRITKYNQNYFRKNF